MSQLYVTVDSIAGDVLYDVLAYRYLRGSCGYFFIIIIKKEGEAHNRIMVIRDGLIFDYLEDKRQRNDRKQFSFKKTNLALSSAVSEDFIIIAGYNDVDVALIPNS